MKKRGYIKKIYQALAAILIAAVLIFSSILYASYDSLDLVSLDHQLRGINDHFNDHSDDDSPHEHTHKHSDNEKEHSHKHLNIMPHLEFDLGSRLKLTFHVAMIFNEPPVGFSINHYDSYFLDILKPPIFS